MKKTFLFFCVVVICYVIARLLLVEKGYVLLAWGPYTLESSLWSFIFAVTLVVISVMFAVGVVRFIFNGISLFYPVTRNARRKKALNQATKGMIYYVNGRWRLAQRLLFQAANAGQAPLITYLAAARAAHQNNDYESCADYLREADRAAPGAELAIGITRAELLLERGQLEQALATLKRLHKKAPSHLHVMKLLKQNYLLLKDWNALVKLLPDLRKKKVISGKEYEKLHQRIYSALFEQAFQSGNHKSEVQARLQPVQNIWKSLSHQHKKDEYLICEYASVLVRLEAEKEAEYFIRQQLPQHYSKRLMNLYGSLTYCELKQQLSKAESLLTQYPNDEVLLLNLGKICIRNNLTGKALEYLEKSLGIAPSVDACNLMGQLFMQQKEYRKSTDYFNRSAKLMTAELS